MQIKIDINGKYNPTKEQIITLLNNVQETISEQLDDGEVTVKIDY